MIFHSFKATRRLQNRGELGVPWHVFLVSEAGVRIAQARVRLGTCAEEDACLHRPKPGAAGIERSTSISAVMPCAQPLLQLASQHWSCQKVSNPHNYLCCLDESFQLKQFTFFYYFFHDSCVV